MKETGRRVRDVTAEADAGVIEFLALKMEGSDHEPSNTGSSRSWKSQGKGFSPSASRRNAVLLKH